LARLFDNLVNNAIRYGKEGGRLDIELRQKNGIGAVRIINYGNPIPEKELPLIFERFYKADPSRSRYAGGSGIGLAIVMSIAEMHQGTVHAESGEGRTVFEVSLPAIQA
jgi:signal transduction histidine kinase